MAAKKRAAAPTKADWDRDQFSVRLTAARRARLLQLASQLPAGVKPTEVVDRAIEIALDGCGSDDNVAARLAGLEERLAASEAKLSDEVGSTRALTAQALSEVRHLSELISAVANGSSEASSSEDGIEGPSADRSTSLRSWLDARGVGVATVSAVARWRMTSRLSDRMVAVEFEIASASAAGPKSTARIEPLDIASPLASADIAKPLSLECRRDPRGGWLVTARRIKPDRTAGEVVGEIKV